MFTTIADFERAWKQNADGTAKMMNALTDASLNQAVADGHRTLGRVAWHIITTIPEMCNRTGLGVTAVKEDAPVPATAKEVADAYRKAADDLLANVKSKWSDTDLATEVDLYGEKWPNGLTLNILIAHEIHHRGQMTILMRQAGLKVPGVFGPSKEEWANFGAPEPEV
jgi:uncharacterized damage-inducible protein DinB